MGARLREAREARGLTQIALSEQLGLSRSAIGQYESGAATPRPDVMARLPQALDVSPNFFLHPALAEAPATTFYRSMSAATATARARAERRFGWLKRLVDYLAGFVEFPVANLPDLDAPKDPLAITDEFIENVAEALRRHWGLGDGPVSNVTHLLENNGAIVCRLTLGAATLDAFSQWRSVDWRPYFVLGADKDVAARSRLDAAHELGHMVLHRRVEARFLRKSPEFKALEGQAFRFAGAFLLPARSFLNDFVIPTIDALVALKVKWNVSVGAMIVRARSLGLLPEDHEARLWRSYARRGMKRVEPMDDMVPVERPVLLRQALTLLLEQGIQSKSQVRYALPFGTSDIEELAGLPDGFLVDIPKPQLASSLRAEAGAPRERSAAALRLVAADRVTHRRDARWFQS